MVKYSSKKASPVLYRQQYNKRIIYKIIIAYKQNKGKEKAKKKVYFLQKENSLPAIHNREAVLELMALFALPGRIGAGRSDAFLMGKALPAAVDVRGQ
ncbi:MAG: hypothetical protein IJX71_06875 [Oscillospiraceae bacterium]|nr:hypothetical protein [Oscillospiraceae bacterium]